MSVKLKSSFKKYKVQLSIAAVIVLVLGVVYAFRLSLSEPYTGVFKNQTVEGLSFENAQYEYENGLSTYKVEVYNESDKEFLLKTITVKFTFGSKETISLTGYIGNSLDKEESKYLQVSVDKELPNITQVQYIINK